MVLCPIWSKNLWRYLISKKCVRTCRQPDNINLEQNTKLPLCLILTWLDKNGFLLLGKGEESSNYHCFFWLHRTTGIPPKYSIHCEKVQRTKEIWTSGKVSFHGVKSYWGDCISFLPDQGSQKRKPSICFFMRHSVEIGIEYWNICRILNLCFPLIFSWKKTATQFCILGYLQAI